MQFIGSVMQAFNWIRIVYQNVYEYVYRNIIAYTLKKI